MRKPIAIGDMVKMKGSKRIKSAPVGIVVKVYDKIPQFISAECEVLWLDSGEKERVFRSQLSRITLDHV